MSWNPLKLAVFAALVFAAAHPRAATPTVQAGSQANDTAKGQLAELWVEPEKDRDLFWGVGGQRLAPNPSATYTVLKAKKGGFSDGYTVEGPAGKTWSVKLYPEARTEVVASRIVWGLGYHQPPIYTLEKWNAEGSKSENPQPVARFRDEMPSSFHGLTEGEPWAYDDNPFVGSRQLKGLMVLQVMLANADIKPAQNMLYTLSEPFEGARRWYVARDLGQSFGRSGLLEATRDDIDSYDQTRFITGVKDGHVQFEYYSRQGKLMNDITPQDVRWICERMSMISDKQWLDAFRAGGYAESTAQRYIRRLKIKIAEGLALEG